MQNLTPTKKKAKASLTKAAMSVCKPLPFQVKNIEEHVRCFAKGVTLSTGEVIRTRLEGSDMGYGKTFISCFTAKRLKRKIAVVCPKASLDLWREAAELVGVEILFIKGYESLVRGNNPWVQFPKRKAAQEEYAKRLIEWEEKKLQLGDRAFEAIKPRMAIVEDNSCEFCFDDPDSVLLVFDEVHRCKGLDSLTSELLIAARRQQLWTLACSATSACGPGDMRALGYALGLHKLEDFVLWAKCHGCIQSQYGALEYYGGQEGLNELHAEIFKGAKLGSRGRIADLPKGMFPETQISADAYDMGNDTAKIDKVYLEMERELDDWEQNRTGSRHPLVVMLRARQKVELLKVPVFVEMAQDAIASGMRVLLFLNFRASMFALAERLKTSALFYGGNVRDRKIHLKNFQENKIPLMILNTAAGAESISCHDLDGRYPRLSLISPGWSALKTHQVFGRTHRAGGKSLSINKLVYAANTIEAKICAKVRTKLANMSTLNDGDFMSDHMVEFLTNNNGIKRKLEDADVSGSEYETFIEEISKTLGEK